MKSSFPELYIHRYELQPVAALNRRSSSAKRQGVLLRSSTGGVACIQPWPELGDSPLADELDALKSRQPLGLGRRALDCLRADGEARQKRKSLFSPGLDIPDSHATLPPGNVGEKALQSLHDAGFRTGKVKAPEDPSLLIKMLSSWSALLPEWTWRIDFNQTLTGNQFPSLAKSLIECTGGRIDFFEDPVPYDRRRWSLWERNGLSLAADRLPAGLQPESPLPLRVWKPALDAIEIHPARKWVVTSYMDHPVGQAWAAYEAARLNDGTCEVLLCGLVTQHLYCKTAFSELMGTPSPVFPPLSGTGLGFDDLIESIRWEKLVQAKI